MALQMTLMPCHLRAAVCALTLWLASLTMAAVPGEPPPFKKPKPDESDAFFASRQIPRLKIEIGPKEVEQLNRANREYVRCTVREDDKFVYDFVGIHLKGAAGSFRGLGDKPALSLNFDKFRDNQKFHGLDKLHLNNSVQDGGLMHEAISRSVFLDAGVPVGRATHALVTLNGRDLGLYVLVEGFDRTFLKRHFQNPAGNFYDGGFCQDLDAQKKLTSNNKVQGQSDLKAVWDAAQEPDPAKRFQRLQQVLDVDRFYTFVALELMLSHWDGYVRNRNNYRLFVPQETGKLIFMPSGMDQMLGDPNFDLWGMGGGHVATQLMNTPEGKKAYRERVTWLHHHVFKPELLHARVDEWAEKLKSVNPQHFAGVAADLKRRITARSQVIARQVGAPVAPVAPRKPVALGRAEQWQPKSDGGTPLHTTSLSNGKKYLHIRAGGETLASWRATLPLEAGPWRFEGVARTLGVVSSDGAGAGLRISGGTRGAGLNGNTEWKKVEFDFDSPGGEVTLVCELRGGKGDAWFELDALRVVPR
jgi:hypothetical protein